MDLSVIFLFVVAYWCWVHTVCRFFFFQAEDGIRDLVRSRGLGDVYKRQLFLLAFGTARVGHLVLDLPAAQLAIGMCFRILRHIEIHRAVHDVGIALSLIHI